MQSNGFPLLCIFSFLIIVKPQLHRTAHIGGIVALKAVGIVSHQAGKLCVNRTFFLTNSEFSTVFRRKAAISLQLPGAYIAAFIRRVKILIEHHAVGAVFHRMEEDVIQPKLCAAPCQRKAQRHISCPRRHCRTGDHSFPWAAVCAAVQRRHGTLHRLGNLAAILRIRLQIHPNRHCRIRIARTHPERKFIDIPLGHRQIHRRINSGFFHQRGFFYIHGSFACVINPGITCDFHACRPCLPVFRRTVIGQSFKVAVGVIPLNLRFHKRDLIQIESAAAGINLKAQLHLTVRIFRILSHALGHNDCAGHLCPAVRNRPHWGHRIIQPPATLIVAVVYKGRIFQPTGTIDPNIVGKNIGCAGLHRKIRREYIGLPGGIYFQCSAGAAVSNVLLHSHLMAGIARIQAPARHSLGIDIAQIKAAVI